LLQFRRLGGHLQRVAEGASHVRMRASEMELERMELEEENQVIRWREGTKKGLGWPDVVGGMYSKA